MIKSLLFIFFIYSGQILMACDCIEFTREYEEDNSNVIFLGKIIEINSEYYKIELLESFKNRMSSRDSVYRIEINSCSISTTVDEIWLIYGQVKDGKLDVNPCGYSKSLTFFNQGKSSKIVPPPPLDYTREEEEIVVSMHHSKVANQLYFTINSLRMKKLEEMIKKNGKKDMQNDVLIEDGFGKSYHLVLAVLNLILLIFLAFKIRSIEGNSRARS